MKNSKWPTVILSALLLLGGVVSAQAITSGDDTVSGDRSRDREPILPQTRTVAAQQAPAAGGQAESHNTTPPPVAAPPRHLWGDCDNDGLKDLFVLFQKGNILFQNQRDGRFKDVTAIAFPTGAGRGGEGFFGDYNGDGLADLFLYHDQGFVLYRNDGDLRFTDVTETLGLPPELAGTLVSLEDYDGDGFGDLLVQTPGGDRILRNNKGQGFAPVDLDGVNEDSIDSGSGSLPRVDGSATSSFPSLGDLSKKGKFFPSRQPPVVSKGPVGPDEFVAPGAVYDSLYINDNSPNSVGVGIPEVEGGDDASTQNDIVDGTVGGTDLECPLFLTDDVIDAVLSCENLGTDVGRDTAIRGEASRYGFYGLAQGLPPLTSYGVYGKSECSHGTGVRGYASSTTGETCGISGRASSPDGYGVLGSNPITGVKGEATDSDDVNYGILGTSDSANGYGVHGTSANIGVKGVATGNHTYSYGLWGEASDEKGRGVIGYATSPTGLTRGVYGKVNSDEGRAVWGNSTSSTGVTYGVMGTAASPDGWGGYFTGRCSTDVLQIRGGSDLSENFDIGDAGDGAEPAPGMVVCIDPQNPGKLVVSQSTYDRTVAGIISGAGGINTGMLMGQEGSEANGESPVALTGRVYCWVDASKGAVEPGDLLTTSDLPGCAMKVTDHARAQGAIIGKAMTSLKEGKGLVLVLVTLQ